MDLVFLAKFTGTGVSPGGQDGYEAAVLTCFLIILSGPQLERILGSFLLMRGTQGSGRGGVMGGDRLSARCNGSLWKTCWKEATHSEAQGHRPVQKLLFVTSGPALRGSRSDLSNRGCGGALQ